ncbi:MAG: cobyrinate a,c-diamide synthase [Gammaproteobacteria bacterium]
MTPLFISAAHKSSGKTTVTVGLCAAFAAKGLTVQSFKKGPDYIDPMWLARASGRTCHNLDFYTMDWDEILATVITHGRGSDMALIEGNKGLYDGLDLDGSNSNAALAKLLGTPIILVLDARGMTRGIAPLILGYQAFDPGVPIAGVILNQLGGSRHEAKLRAVIEHYTDVTVVGAIHRNPRLEIVERHLGLIPSNEDAGSNDKIVEIGKTIAAQVDLERLLEFAAAAPPLPTVTVPRTKSKPGSKVRIGVARDAAFGFYYPGDLEAFELAGAELIFVNTLSDSHLPDLDGLFIGGGFPEIQMQSLEANTALRSDIRESIASGLPAYAECGGLMYLCRSLSWDERRCNMVGVIPADVVMHKRPQGRGYVRLRENENGLWPNPPVEKSEIAGHEFHYSNLSNVEKPFRFAYNVTRGTGVDGKHDGIVINNLLACYSHQRHTRQNPWAQRFVEFVRQCTADHHDGAENRKDAVY